MRILAGTLAVAAIAWWAVRGANMGWTKTSVPVSVLDVVTGIEGITYEQRFVPGIDFLGAALLGAGLLAGASLFIRKQTKSQRGKVFI